MRAAEDGAREPASKAHVEHVRFENAIHIGPADLQKAVEPWVNRDLSFAEMNEAAGAVTALYRARGFLVAKAYLPPQAIENGVLTVAVIEGRAGTVTVGANTSGVSDRQLLLVLRGPICGRREPCGAGRPLRSRDVERGALLVSDIPGVRSTLELKPGSQPGTTDVVLNAEPTARFTATAGADNAGFAATGRARGSLGATAANLTGRGDLTSLGLTYAGKGLSSFAFDAGGPVGGGGLRIGLQAGRLRYALGREFAVLGATGASDQAGAYASYPLARTLQGRADLRLDVSVKDIRSDIDRLNSRSRQRAWGGMLTLSGDWRDGRLRAAVSQYRIAYAHGRLDLRDPLGRALDRQTARTGGGYGKVNYLLRREEVVTPGWTVFGQVSGQYATKNLDSSEKMPLGGASAVRAYDAGAASADTAAIATLETRVRLTQSGPKGWQVVVAPFYDYAWARFNSRTWVGYGGPETGRLAGGGAYVSLAKPGRLSIRATYARRQSRNGAGRGGPDQVWLETAAAF